MTENEIRLEAQDLNQQAGMLIKAGNYEAAAQKIEKAIEIDPMLADSYRNKGDLYIALGKYEDAKNAYKKALLIEKDGLLYFLYGNACFMNDDVHEGLENYNLAISAGYDSDEMMFFMGMAYEHLNDDNMALRYFHKACAKNPSRADYQVKKIAALIRLDMLENAEKCVDELLLNSPELYDGYHIKTQILLHRGALQEAAAFSKSAAERFPEDADLMYDYVKCVAQSGDHETAIRLISSAKRMKYFENAKRQFLILEAEISAEKGNFDYAIQCCEECTAMESDQDFDGEARFMLMNLHLTKPDYQLALDQANTIVKKDLEDLYYYAALYYRAFCTKQLENAEEARVFYKEANSIYRLATIKNPGAIDIYLYRAMCLKDMEDYDKALEMLDFIAGLSDQIAEVHTLKADIYTTQGRKSLAEEELQKAYKIKPELNPDPESAGE